MKMMLAIKKELIFLRNYEERILVELNIHEIYGGKKQRKMANANSD